MIHKGIEYFLTATSESDVWQWRFQIGDEVKTGKTRTRLPSLAERRVQSKIGAALKARGAVPGSPQPSMTRKIQENGTDESVRGLDGR